MTNRPDKRFLIFVLIFGIVGTAAGIRWLASGSIEIRQGSPNRIVTSAASEKPAVGKIVRGDVLYYPLCLAWIGLGSAMIALPALAFFTSRELYARLAAYCCVGILLLGFATVAAALWSGP